MSRLGIEIVAKNKASAALGKTKRQINDINKSAGKVNTGFKKMAGLAAGVTAALGGLKLAKDFLQTANMFEQLNIQLKYITGSAEDGATALDTVREAAKRSAFSLESMSQATPILLTVSSIGQLNDTLDITGDIAAATGMSFEEVASQLQRSFSGGIAAADMFREKGVKSMLGFQEGVQYSAEETEKIIRDLWKNNNTTMKGAMEDMSKTFTAQVGMLGDAWLDFKQTTMEAGVFPALKEELGDLRKFIKDHEKEIEQYAIALGENIGEAIIAIGESIKFIADHADLFKTAAKGLVALGLAKWFYGVAAAAYTLGTRLLFVQTMAGPAGIASVGLGLLAMGTSIGVVNALFGKTEESFSKEELEAKLKSTNSEIAKLEKKAEELNEAMGTVEFTPEWNQDFTVDLGDAADEAHRFGIKVAKIPEGMSGLVTILNTTTTEITRLKEEAADLDEQLFKFFNEKKEWHMPAQIKQDLEAVGKIIDKKFAADMGIDLDRLEAMGKITGTNTDMLTKMGNAFSPTTEMAKNFIKAITTSTEMLSHNNKVSQDYVHWQDAVRISWATSTDMLSHNSTAISTNTGRRMNAIEIMQAEWEAKQKLIEQAKKEALFQTMNYKKQFDAFKAFKLGEIDFSEMSEDKKKEFAMEGGRTVLREAAKHNKKAFQLNKAFNIAEATMSTFTAVANALKYGGAPPLNFILAGLVGAMGAVQIAGIASQQYSGRRYGGPVSNKDSYIVGESGPELFTPGATGRITSNEGMIDTRPVNVNFNITATDAASVDELIVARRGMIVNMVRQATQERGNRPNF